MDIQEYQCDICDKIFPEIGTLKYHQITEHKKLHKCEKCNKTFSKRAWLIKHIRVTTIGATLEFQPEHLGTFRH